MYAPFNIVVKITEGTKVIYLNTEQAIKIEIINTEMVTPEVHITMSDGTVHKLTGSQAEAFRDRVEGR